MATASFERCGRYELREVLGEGGMGTVYRARDPELARDVAIKIVHGWPLDDRHLERFRREAQLLARLPHPHIVSIFDVGSIGDEPFIVMELVAGRSLAAFIADGPSMPFEDKLRVAAQICDALACAHAAGVVHRDVKPGNILLTAEGLAKLADFGIARCEDVTLTATAQVVGSPAYLAPEFFEGHPADARSDIYGLAATLYEWLAGVRPHEAKDARALAAQLVHEDARPLSDHWLDCPPSLERCLQRALSRDPAARHQSAEALAVDLRVLLGRSASDPVAITPQRPATAAGSRHARLAAIAGVTAALLLGGTVLWDAGRAEPNPPARPDAALSEPDAAPGATPNTPQSTNDLGGSGPIVVAEDGIDATIQVPQSADDLQSEDEEVTTSLPVGTTLRARVLTQLRTDQSLAGHEFAAELSDPVVWEGRRVADAGTAVKGLVHEVGAGSTSGPAFFQLSLTALRLADVDVPIRTARYRVVAPPDAGASLRVLILGAAIGALAGGAVAGSEGAVSGGAIGATLSTPPSRRHEPIVLTAPLPFKLVTPLPLSEKAPQTRKENP